MQLPCEARYKARHCNRAFSYVIRSVRHRLCRWHRGAPSVAARAAIRCDQLIDRASSMVGWWCPGPESNRHGLAACGFSYPPRLSPPRCARLGSGVRHDHCRPIEPLQVPAVHSLRLPVLLGAAPDWFGVTSGSSPGDSPTLTGSGRAVSVPAAQMLSSPLRLPVSPPGHRGQVYRFEQSIGGNHRLCETEQNVQRKPLPRAGSP
jgi:hypothetical protein